MDFLLVCGGMPESTRTEHLVSFDYPSITSVLTTLETYVTSLDLVLWSVLASGRRWLGVLCMRVYTRNGLYCVCG